LNSPGNHPALVSDTGERALIERIQRRLPPAAPGVLVGVGDDAAVIRPERGSLQVLTTDALVQGVHFDFRFSSPADVGYKALGVNVSDVAAMGGLPRVALLSLMLPADTAVEVVDGLLDGVMEMAAVAGVTLVGGNITSSVSPAAGPGPLIVDVSVIGSVKPRKVLLRSGGRPGDSVYVTGSIGAAAAGLGWLRSTAPATGSPEPLMPSDPALAECVMRHRRPEPRARIGSLLGRNRAASACMDLSDGLADAVTQVAAASGTGVAIDAATLPVHPGAIAWFTSLGLDPVTAALSGGDDYELLFTVPKRRRGRLRAVIREGRGIPVTRIGELTPGNEVVLVRDNVREPLPAGFAHFTPRRSS
jgi:thiamine-monophosphate kinase